MEDERDESETIDSGDDAVETDVASEDRRAGQVPGGELETEQGWRSRDAWVALTVPTWPIARPMALPFPNIWDVALTAGVQNPLVCGVRRGVGRRPRAGARRPGVPTGLGTVSRTDGAPYRFIPDMKLVTSPVDTWRRS